MLEPTWTTIRLFLHVLSATIWVGGQIVLAGLVPALRRHDASLTKVAARAFNRVAWPAFGVVVITGIWNLLSIDVSSTDWNYQSTVMVHVLLAGAASAAAAVHAIGHSRVAMALGGGIGLVASLGTLFIGLLLRTGQ